MLARRVLAWSTPLFIVGFYLLGLSRLGGLRVDHIYASLALVLLWSFRSAVPKVFQFIMPFLLTGILYDSQRFYAHLIRGPIHVKEPYFFDLTFFGLPSPNGTVTPNEWWQTHTHVFLDLLTGFAYLVFVAVFVSVAAYFVFYLGKKGTSYMSPQEVLSKAQLMPWAFLILNILGYSTYYWYAAAPPWYVSRYGLGPAQVDVQASSAGCARFDEFLGTHFFSEMYGRAADVFGAIPSLHVAYPLLAVIFAFHFRSLRLFCLCFYFVMCFSAVYLNHHYILDILWGSLYALAIGRLTLQYWEFRKKKTITSQIVQPVTA